MLGRCPGGYYLVATVGYGFYSAGLGRESRRNYNISISIYGIDRAEIYFILVAG